MCSIINASSAGRDVASTAALGFTLIALGPGGAKPIALARLAAGADGVPNAAVGPMLVGSSARACTVALGACCCCCGGCGGGGGGGGGSGGASEGTGCSEPTAAALATDRGAACGVAFIHLSTLRMTLSTTKTVEEPSFEHAMPTSCRMPVLPTGMPPKVPSTVFEGEKTTMWFLLATTMLPSSVLHNPVGDRRVPLPKLPSSWPVVE